VRLKKNGEISLLLLSPAVVIPVTRWLYALILDINAKFHLKHKNVSNDMANPDLNEGCVYIMEEKEYKKYLAEYKAEIEPVR
jgi:hypothetical protein